MKEETNPTWKEVHGGFAKDMTMRDHYAGLAMQGMLANGPIPIYDCEFYSARAYEMADAMLKARGAK
jgi:hypothetical protein